MSSALYFPFPSLPRCVLDSTNGLVNEKANVSIWPAHQCWMSPSPGREA